MSFLPGLPGIPSIGVPNLPGGSVLPNASNLLQGIIGTEISQAFDELGGIIDIIPKGHIGSGGPGLGGIAIQATLEETHHDMLQVTEHPVEKGAEISDHSYVRNPEVTLRCGWSNSVVQDIFSAVISPQDNFQLPTAAASFAGGQMSVSDYVSGVYSQLIQLQQSGTTFALYTSIRVYDSMVMTSLSLTRDVKTTQALMVTASFKQIRVVSTSSSTLPPIASQETPADTNGNQSVGAQSLGPPAPSTLPSGQGTVDIPGFYDLVNQ